MITSIRRHLVSAIALAFALVPGSLPAELTLEQVKTAIPQLEQLTQKEMGATGVPGIAIAVVFKDECVYAKGFGVREVGKPAPIDADTVFQLASVSKPIAATVVAAIIGEGKITWDSRIRDLDPGFAMVEPFVTREITIRDFFAHRSGLPEHAGDLLEDLGFTREEILRRLRFQRPDSSFRAGYAYTNFGLTEGTVAAAKANGRTWEEVAQEKLFKPLGMNSTSPTYADFMARPNKALGHVQVDGKWTQKYKRDPDPQSPAGGVSSSVNDLAKWMRLQLGHGKFEGKQMVDEKALEETHHPHMLTGFSPDGLPGFYGLGWNVSYDQQGRLRLSHSGAFALGAATNVNLVPREQLGMVVLTNAYPIGVAEGLAATFMDLVLYGKPARDWLAVYKQLLSSMNVAAGFDYSKPPATTGPALDNQAYLGNYTNDFFGNISIIERNGALAIVEGPRGKTFPMKHYDRDTFTYETEGEGAVQASGITFTIGADGRATSVMVENLNLHGEGSFKRVPNRK